MKKYFFNSLLFVLFFFISFSQVQAGPVFVYDGPWVNGAPQGVIHPYLRNNTMTVDAAAGNYLSTLESIRDEYNTIVGSNFRLVVNANGSSACTVASVSAAWEAYRNGQRIYALFICPASVMGAVLGWPPGVLGQTGTRVASDGEITGAAIFIRDDLGGGQYFRSVTQHEIGHGIGLDHTMMINDRQGRPTVMFPHANPNGEPGLSTEDVNAVLNLYVADPLHPQIPYSGEGACIRGRVTATFNLWDDSVTTIPVSGALVGAHFGQDINPAFTTGTSSAFRSTGETNDEGEYTLCGDRHELENVVVHLCPFDTSLAQVLCGGAGRGSGIFGYLSMKYPQTGQRFIFTNEGETRLFRNNNDFNCGKSFHLSAGEIVENVDFHIDPFDTGIHDEPCIAPPVVNAGADSTIRLPTHTVQLNATATHPEARSLSYGWTVDPSVGASFSDSAALNPTLTVPDNTTTVVNYTVRLTVTVDSTTKSAFDEMIITVQPKSTTGVNPNPGGGSNPKPGNPPSANGGGFNGGSQGGGGCSAARGGNPMPMDLGVVAMILLPLLWIGFLQNKRLLKSTNE